MINKKKQLLELLKIHYNYTSFRPGQEQAIDSILKNENTLAILPTGGGKSLIYQLPALVLEGITIVVSPLIALMKDQVESLDEVGIPATYINSSLSLNEINKRTIAMKNSQYRLVYISPERFNNLNFLNDLKKTKVSLFAIDEAHCISQWGHDFRPSYLRLKNVVKEIGSPIVVALTATATIEVREDIMKQLNLNKANLIVSGFARPNLHFGVVLASASQKKEEIINLFKKSDLGAGIIYVGTRAKADELVDILNDFHIKAVEYHAGLDNDSRNWVQEQFMKGEAQVVVATNAFGLGINKKNIRFVLHYDIPGTIEAYYQEAGRAGRDRKDSLCILFYSKTDKYLQEFFISGDNPSPETVIEVYRYLLKINENREYNQDSLLLTYSELAKNLDYSVPEMAIGTSLKILENKGYISRPNERKANAYLKLKISMEEAYNTTSQRAKKQKELLEKLNEKYLNEIKNGWTFSLDEESVILKIEKSTLQRTIKSLSDKDIFEFRPPFRGTEVKIKKIINPDDLIYNLDSLIEKTKKAYKKLEVMENYVYTADCRQAYILKYFGEENIKNCGKCDNCLSDNLNEETNNLEYLGNY